MNFEVKKLINGEMIIFDTISKRYYSVEDFVKIMSISIRRNNERIWDLERELMDLEEHISDFRAKELHKVLK